MNRNRTVRLLLVGTGLLVATSVALAYADAWHQRSRAERLLSVLSTIQVGRSTESDVATSTAALAGYARRQVNSGHLGVTSELEFTFQNHLMALLHFSPPKYLYVGLEFKDGVVTSKSLNFYQAPRFGVIVQEVNAGANSDSKKLNARELHINNYGQNMTVIEIRDDTSVPQVRRQLDWQIDLSCMTEMSACRDAHRILPGVGD
jgi:hypothetical protein